MKQALLTLKASGLIVCYPNSETMEITINKIFCLNLYENPLRDTWYSRKYAEPQKDRGQQPRFDHGRYTTWSTGYILHHDACMYASRTGCGYTVLSVYCQCLVILQPIRAREIYLLKKVLNLSQSERLIDLFISPTQDKFGTIKCSSSRSSHLKIGVLVEKQRQGIKSHTFRSIINCYAADQKFCEYEYRERVVFV